jgi:hypothetical protein
MLWNQAHAEACGEPLSPSPSRLQEAEKQSQALHQEVAELREELRARGPGGEWPELCSSLIVTKELL